MLGEENSHAAKEINRISLSCEKIEKNLGNPIEQVLNFKRSIEFDDIYRRAICCSISLNKKNNYKRA
jgi:hypothetical protein